MDFIDLKTQQSRIRAKIDARLKKILDTGSFIMGAEVEELESALRNYTGAAECISCSNGTDALRIVLMALGIGVGDVVLVPAFTFFATAEAVSLVGATPVFVDVDSDTFTITPASLEDAIARSKERHPMLSVRGVIPVSLFGICPDFTQINDIALRHNMFVLEDAAQSFGASLHNRKSCNLTPFAATSFFPAKPLGCYGDGGAIFCADPEMAKIMRSIRVHGQGQDRYDNVRIGLTGRLDTMQAAILLEKLEIFPDEVSRRQEVAEIYTQGLADLVQTPKIPNGCTSAWAQYTIKTSRRDHLVAHLKEKKIPSMIYYSKPLHLQKAFSHLGYREGELPVSERLCKEVVSLPMHPYLSPQVHSLIIDEVRAACSPSLDKRLTKLVETASSLPSVTDVPTAPSADSTAVPLGTPRHL